jgi:hypothetical protein
MFHTQKKKKKEANFDYIIYAMFTQICILRYLQERKKKLVVFYFFLAAMCTHIIRGKLLVH